MHQFVLFQHGYGIAHRSAAYAQFIRYRPHIQKRHGLILAAEYAFLYELVCF